MARRLTPRRTLLLLGLVVVGYLYYHPLRTYLDTRHELAGRAAEVQGLKAQKHALERRLARASTPQSLQRAARMELSLVKPGEELDIVRGIADWRRARHPAK